MSLLTLATLATASPETLVGSGFVCTTTETAVSQGLLLTPEPDCGGSDQVWVFGPGLIASVEGLDGPIEVWGHQRAGVRTGTRVVGPEM